MNTSAPSIDLDEFVIPELAEFAPTPPAVDEAPPLALEALTTGGVIELLLKDQRRLDTALRDEPGQRVLIPKLLGIAMGGFAIYGIVATVMLNLAQHHNHFWLPGVPAAAWNHASAGNLTLAYCLGMIAANGICLPSFYFYGLLAGVRITMLGIVAHALKGMAAGALALVAILPIYLAFTLNAVVYGNNPVWLGYFVFMALTLPFLAGIWGAICLYRGFLSLADTIPDRCREDRTCFLRRLILAWSGCYTLVTPLVIYTLWRHLSEVLP